MNYRQCPARAFDAIETELVGGHVLLTRIRGHATGLMVERRFDQFRAELGGVCKPVWIVEQLELTGFDPSAVTAGARWFTAFKDRGGERIISVSQMAAARMVAATLAFAVHARLFNCGTLSEAYEQAGLGAVEIRPSLYPLTPRE
ncbi:MAG: hypothetical protein K0R38_2235 [Polyangiaceae bacterium]|nr:hypothetical protein [Polyangiaceae bacterium]